MLSRIADSLFWLNRYIERSDTLLRLVYVNYILSLERSSVSQFKWRPVLEIGTLLTDSEIATIESDVPAVIRRILIAEENPNSIRCIINKARENARGAQDHITKEVWEAVNHIYHQVNQPSISTKLKSEQAIKVIENLSRSMVLFTGITDNTMSRGLGWNFMQLGKYFERCLQTIAIVNKQMELKTGEALENDIFFWRHILFSLSGYEMHLKTYRGNDHTHNVLHQVILSENFPHSVMYSLMRSSHYLENIMGLHKDQNETLKRTFGKLYSKVRYMDIQSADPDTVRDFLGEVKAEMGNFSQQLGQYYFSYT